MPLREYFSKFDICIKNYKIIKREDFIKNDCITNNALQTIVYAVELHYVLDSYYELHLLFVNKDNCSNEKYWYLTLRGTDIKIIENGE